MNNRINVTFGGACMVEENPIGLDLQGGADTFAEERSSTPLQVRESDRTYSWLVRIVVLLVALLCGTAIQAADYFTVDNLEYQINYKGDVDTQTVTLLNGDWKSDDYCPSGKFVVPRSVEHNGKTYIVTHIYDLTAYNNKASQIREIIIPNTVRYIHQMAFSGCTDLQSLIIEDGKQTLWFSCRYSSDNIRDLPLKNVYIGRNFVVDVGTSGTSYTVWDRVFDENKTIESVTIGGYCTKLRDSEFEDCTSLKRVIIGDSVTGIGSCAFRYCSNLSSITISNSVTAIGDSSFKGCTNLSRLTLSESLEEIPEYAFADCKSLVRLSLPESIKTLGRYAFANCGIKELYLPDSLSSFENTTFNECVSLEKVVIGNGIKKIPAYAFTHSQYLHSHHKEFVIGKSVTELPTTILDASDSGIKIISYAEIAPKIGNESFVRFSKYDPTLYVTSTAKGYNVGTWVNYFNVRQIEMVESISIDFQKSEDNLDMAVATVLPETATDKNIIWSSSDNDVVTVDRYGIINAKNPGDAYIIATAHDGSGVTVKYPVRVLPVPVDEISLNMSEMTLLVGDSNQLTATIEPINATYKDVVWSSDNEEVATVSADGLVTALSVGEANVTATCGEVTATCKVTVNPVLASEVTLNMSDMSLLIGESEQLTATIAPENTTFKDIVWTSDNEEVATVSEDGLVTALSVGEANVTATCGEVTATCKVTVNPVLASDVILDISEMILLVGECNQLTAAIEPENTTFKDIVWTSHNEDVATVSEDGLVTAISVGEANVSATCGEVTATCKVTVNPVLASDVILDISEMILLVGECNQLTAAIEPENTTFKDIVWASDNEEVATVSEDGLVTALSVGEANVTATCGEVTATCKVTVNPVLASEVILNTTEMTLFVGESNHLTAAIEPENTTFKDVVWTSDNEDVATVSADGLVTALSVGEANITATCGEVSATCKVTVNPILAAGVILNISSMQLIVGESEQLTATVKPDNTTVKDVVWTSDNEEVATVSADGLVTALSVGAARITATCGEVSATCKVAVNPVLVESVSLDPSAWIGEEGESFRITASILPANADNKTLEWTSSDKTVASVDNEGNVDVHGAGSCVIIAMTTDGSGLFASCLITSTSDVQNLFGIYPDTIEIYNLQGTCIMVTTDDDFKDRLVPGVYIIRKGSELEKVIIR